MTLATLASIAACLCLLNRETARMATARDLLNSAALADSDSAGKSAQVDNARAALAAAEQAQAGSDAAKASAHKAVADTINARPSKKLIDVHASPVVEYTATPDGADFVVTPVDSLDDPLPEVPAPSDPPAA